MKAPLHAALVGNEGLPWVHLARGAEVLHLRANQWEIEGLSRTLPAASWSDPRAIFRHIAEQGFAFAAVYERPRELWAAVDHVRAHPLLYAHGARAATVTDDPYRACTAPAQLDDETALIDFQLAGYTTGARTLSSDWRGLRAGECMRFRLHGDSVGLDIESYAPRAESPALRVDELPAAESELRAICDLIFDTLCRGLHGRQAVVPLSGGIDSQFIVAMLKRHGCNDIVAFSYGQAGNAEARASRQTAERLGIQWHFVPYSRDRWRNWYASEEMRAFLPFCSRHVSTPHLQDWPAVQALKAKALLQPDAVFIPGHTAVLTSANRLHPLAFRGSSARRRRQAACLLYRYHFDLQGAARTGARRKEVIDRIEALLPEHAGETDHRLLNAFYDFEATERHAKLVVNSVRIYEFWDYAWALPLWDRRIQAFWARVPYEQRFGKQMFRRAVQGAGLYGLFGAVPLPSPYARWRRRVKENPVTYLPLKRLKCLGEKLVGYFRDPMAWKGIVSYRQYVGHIGKCGSIYSILSRLYLEGLRRGAIGQGSAEWGAQTAGADGTCAEPGAGGACPAAESSVAGTYRVWGFTAGSHMGKNGRRSGASTL